MEIILKTCSKCKQAKPLDDFPRSKTSSDGHYPSCKACKYATTRKWVENNRQHVDEYHREWRAQNKERWNQYGAKWYQRNRRKRLDAIAHYYRENRERITARGRRYYRRTIEHQRARKRRYKQNNPNQTRVDNQRRRARLSGAKGNFTVTEFVQLCEQYGNRCLRCGDEGPLTADHVVPLSAGGGNAIDNIQPLCPGCNASKGVKSTDYRKGKRRRFKQLRLPLP